MLQMHSISFVGVVAVSCAMEGCPQQLIVISPPMSAMHRVLIHDRRHYNKFRLTDKSTKGIRWSNPTGNHKKTGERRSRG